jgi:hypothetical protein
MGEKPTAAFALSLIGAIIYLITGILVVAAAAFLSSISGLISAGGGVAIAGIAVAIVAGVALVSGIVMLLGAVMMNSTNRSRVRTGATLVLVFTFIGAIFTVGGFVIGFILALIGSILGLTWRPPMSTAPA